MKSKTCECEIALETLGYVKMKLYPFKYLINNEEKPKELLKALQDIKSYIEMQIREAKRIS